MKSAWLHGWNLPDFMKSTGFHEICWISGPEIRQISCTKSAGFQGLKSAGFHVFPKWAKDQWSYFYWNLSFGTWTRCCHFYTFNLEWDEAHCVALYFDCDDPCVKWHQTQKAEYSSELRLSQKSDPLVKPKIVVNLHLFIVA